MVLYLLVKIARYAQKNIPFTPIHIWIVAI